VLAALAAVTAPIQIEIFLGQADIFVLFCLSAAFYAGTARKPWAAGALLAVACATKPTMLALVVFLLWKHELKFAAAAVLGFLVLLIAPFVWLGAPAWRDMLTIWSFWSNQYLAYARNDSPKGVLTRIFTTNPVVRPLIHAPMLVTILWLIISAFVVLAAATAVTPRRLRSGPLSLIEYGIALTALLLVSPLMEWPYLLLLVIPLVGCYSWLRTADWRTTPYRNVALGTVLAWLALCGPLTTVEYFIWNHIGNRPIITDLGVVVAPIYLYALVAVFALQIHLYRLASGQSMHDRVRRLVTRPSLDLPSTPANGAALEQLGVAASRE
jgi:hypothetical protein